MLYTILSIDFGSDEPTSVLSSILIHQIVESYDQAKSGVKEVALRIIEEEDGKKKAQNSLKEAGVKLKHLDDGLYLMVSKDKVDTFEMYRVKTNVIKGYLYNSYVKEVKKIRIFTIVSSDCSMPIGMDIGVNICNSKMTRGSEQEHGVHVKLIEELRAILEQRSNKTKTEDSDVALKRIEECIVKKPKKVVEFKPIMDKGASPGAVKNNMMKELQFHFKNLNNTKLNE